MELTTTLEVWNQEKLRWTQSRTSKTISTLKNKPHQMATLTTPNQITLTVKKSKKRSKLNNLLLQMRHKSGNLHSNKQHSQFLKKLKSNFVAF